MKVKKGCYVSARDSRCIKREISSSTNRSPANDFEVDTSKVPPLSERRLASKFPSLQRDAWFKFKFSRNESLFHT